MSRNDGFTLVEMIVVVAIIAILSGIAIANYYAHRQNRQLSRASRDVYSALQAAKLNAIRDNTNVFVNFTPGSGIAGTYLVFEDLDEDNVFDAGVEREFGSGFMPPGITMQNSTFSYTNSATPPVTTNNLTRFTSLGLSSDANGSLPITNGQRTTTVVVGIAGDIHVDY